MLSIYHSEGFEVKQRTTRSGTSFKTEFTTYRAGQVVIESTFMPAGTSFAVEFKTNFKVQPSMASSYVQVEKSILSSSSTLRVKVIMFDEYGNPLEDKVDTAEEFRLQTNIVPAASCNASTQVKDTYEKAGDHYLVLKAMYVPCIYKVQVYFIQNNMSHLMRCSSCDLTVRAQDLSLQRTQFFDLLKKQKIGYQLPETERVINILKNQE